MSDKRTTNAKRDLPDADEPLRIGRTASICGQTSKIDLELFDRFFQAAWHGEAAACRDVVAFAYTIGVSGQTIADDYIPAIAKKMGDMWCADTMSFAEVTIGVARLQAMLRNLGPEWTADLEADPDAPIILLTTLQEAYHTLGAMVMAGQLRRRGFSVRLALNPGPQDLTRQTQTIAFDAVFISASQTEGLEKIRRMVEFLRACSSDTLQIVVGGGILDVGPDIAPLVGADLGTSDIDKAIEFCGLRVRHKKSAKRARRG